MSRLDCLVAGGLGFIGSTVVRKLAERGHSVTVYDDFSNPSGLKQIEGFGSIRVVRGDVLDRKALSRAASKADLLINLAVKCLPESIKNPVDTHMVNDIGTLNVCMACKEHKTRLVQISSSEAYGTARRVPMDESHPLDPTTPYGASKAAGEMIVRGFAKCYGMETLILRPFNAYGPYMREDSYSAVLPRFVSRARAGKRLEVNGDGRQTRDFTHVDDLAEGIARAAEVFPVGETINLARGKEASIVELAAVVISHYRKEGRFKLKDGIEFKPPRQGDVLRHFADVSRARKLIGFRAKVDLEGGVKRYANWFEKTHPSH